MTYILKKNIQVEIQYIFFMLQIAEHKDHWMTNYKHLIILFTCICTCTHTQKEC